LAGGLAGRQPGIEARGQAGRQAGGWLVGSLGSSLVGRHLNKLKTVNYFRNKLII
jgi:hypothetical protein